MAGKFDYAAAQTDADELLAEFGQVGAIRRSEVAGGNAWDPTSGTETVTDYPATVVVLPVDAKDIADTLIKDTDKQILVSVVGLPITPTTTDRVVTADGVYSILRNNTLAPAGVPVLHDIIGTR